MGCTLLGNLSARALMLSAALMLLLGHPARAATVTPQSLTVVTANALGNGVFNMTLTGSADGLSALISGATALNTDGSQHGLFDALVFVPNAKNNTLDLIAADLLKGQLVKYAGPNYGTSTVISSWTRNGSALQAAPVGLAADPAGDLFVVSPVGPSQNKPGLWVLPFNKSTGAYAAPLLIDSSFGGVRTIALAELLVAGTAASPGTGTPAWNAGDLVVLVGDTANARVIVYSQAAINRVIGGGGPLSGPTGIAVPQTLFQGSGVLPVGMDIWPSDATHGVSLLFSTLDGRILRFDSAQNQFVANFASGLGIGLQKVKVGTYAGTPYAFVTQLSLPTTGTLMQLGAPPASGANKPLATFHRGLNEALGLAVTSSGSAPAQSCVGPPGCSPVGNQTNQQFTGPGTANIPAGATVLQQICTVPADPRAAIVNGTWSCLGPQINVCAPGQTTGCVQPTLDVAQYCPGFPSTVLPPSFCGHSGATGTGFAVMEESAVLVDQNANNIFIETSLNADATVPGPYNLTCLQVPLALWAPRSDLPTVEGVVPEDQTLANTFIDLTSVCDAPATHAHTASMYAYGVALNSAASGLGSGPTAGLFGFVTNKFSNLNATLTNAINQSQVNTTVASTLQGYISQSQSYFNSGYQNDSAAAYSCALNSLASTESYLRANATASNFFFGQPPAGNPNVAGDLDGRLGNLFLTIEADFLGAPPNTSWPTANVPPCVTLSASPTSVVAGSASALSWGSAAPTFPLLFPPSQCSLSASDGSFVQPVAEGPIGTAVSTGALTIPGTYTASLQCTGPTGDVLPGLATTSVTVLPALIGVTVNPPAPAIASGATQQFGTVGSFSNGTSGPIGNSYLPVVWSSDSAFAPISASGLASCNGPGTATITATSGNIFGTTTLTCLPANLTGITVTPPSPAVNDFFNQQFAATGTYASGPSQDITASVTWTAAPTNIATISASGLAFCQATGSATITASIGAVSGSTTLTCQAVVSSLSAFPANGITTIPVGGTEQITARAAYTDGTVANVNNQATWTSSNPAAVVTNGLVTGISNGVTNITATFGGASTGPVAFTITGPTLQILNVSPNGTQQLLTGNNLQLTLSGGYSDSSTLDLTNLATWSSSNTAVATVSNGLVTAVAAGYAYIYGNAGGASPANVLVVVSPHP